MQALCVFDSVGDAFEPQLAAFLRDRVNYADLGWDRPLTLDALTLARDLTLGTWQKRAEYDKLLAEHVRAWSIDRMPPVDRNLLRLGLHEILEHPETPYQVVINEAVEVAKAFGGTDSGGFVNGVLDGIRKAIVPGS
jgi:transcription antitermination protein NusB